ncbi:lytic murein transglycosylase [Balneola vulgaris]|uniref:lytic murein transglycosylase n=1 Tax=Balneola vulgaris TaxID=287535 RepID=UPI000380731C|nr:lytic murein transglycosylase [Balneola vulgaris]
MRYQFLTLCLVFFISAITANATPIAANPDDGEYQEQLKAHFAKKGIDISPYFEDERFEIIETIKKKFTRSAEVKIKSLDDYKKVLRYEEKKEAAASFYAAYKEPLAKAEKEYGISQEVIIGILGVESAFGKYKGSYNPFNAYVSMYAKGYRKKFALAQLEELLKFTQRENLDVLALESSYAGAMSYAQFIPWSINRWFVGNDLYNMENNIYSVANYLAHYKKVTGSIEKAVLRYNPSSLYQQAVLALAKDVEPLTE